MMVMVMLMVMAMVVLMLMVMVMTLAVAPLQMMSPLNPDAHSHAKTPCWFATAHRAAAMLAGTRARNVINENGEQRLRKSSTVEKY